MTDLHHSTPPPFADGYHLPVEAYTSDAWFERERRELFDHTWQFAGMSDDLKAEGDFLTSDVGSSGLIVIRGSDGTLKAFHNLCRHRGARLLEGTGNIGRELRCFYHSWAYSLDGDLKRVPQRDQFPQIDMACLGLHKASAEVWKGLVFVHPEPNPEPLMTWLSDFPDAMGPYEPLALTQVDRDVFDVKANWKLFAENHIDGYHLWHLHRTSVVGFNHNQQTWRPVGRHWTFREPPQKPGVSPTEKMGLPTISGLTPDWYGSTVHLLFPNLGIASGAEYWLTLHMVPMAADLTRVEVRTRTLPLDTKTKAKVVASAALDSTWSMLKRQATMLTQQLDRSTQSATSVEAPNGKNQITDEDRRAAESIQQAMKSPRFSVGAMARDYEGAISEFQRNIMAFVADTG
jgi:phenylpropionate dioxygenase-like ring-hydroxylating dioxygenase large terminal subunit